MYGAFGFAESRVNIEHKCLNLLDNKPACALQCDRSHSLFLGMDSFTQIFTLSLRINQKCTLLA